MKCFTDGMVYNGYPCRNSEVCIPLGWLCDKQKDCIGKKSLCELFNCINILLVCNIHFFSTIVEGDDEYNCYNSNNNGVENTNNLYNNNDNWYYTRGICKKYEFRCRSRRMSVCLPNSWLCDGRIDCDDGQVEKKLFNFHENYRIILSNLMSNYQVG